MKKLLLGIGLVIIIAYLFTKFFVGIPLSVGILPQSSIMSFEIKDVSATLKRARGKQFWNTLGHLEFIQQLEYRLSVLDSTIFQESMGKYRNVNVLTSLHYAGLEQYDYLFAVNKRSISGQINTLVDQLKDKNYEILVNTYRQRQIFTANLPEINERLSLVEIDEYIFMSFQQTLVEDAVGQLADGINLYYSEGFNEIHKKNISKRGIPIYVNASNIPLMASAFMDDQHLNSFAKVADIYKWMKFDLELKDNEVKIDGYCTLADNNVYQNALLDNSSAVSPTIGDVLPENIALMAYHSASDFEPIYNKLEEKQPTFEQYILPWMGEEWAYVMLEPLNQNYAEKGLIVIKAKNALNAKAQLGELAANANRSESAAAMGTSNIRYLGSSSAAKVLFGQEVAKAFEHSYYSIVGDYVIIGAHSGSMGMWESENLQSPRLADKPAYQKFLGDRLGNTSWMYYGQTENMPALIGAHARPSFLQYLESHISIYNRITPMALTFSPERRGIRMRGSFGDLQNFQDKDANLILNVPLADKAAMAPQILENPVNGQKDIFVQDASNIIYLISQNGNIIWKQQLSEKVISDVFPITLYGGDKSQLLFNTSSQVFLMAREDGSPQASYPMKLSSPATAGLCVVDFDSNKEYQFFVPCENRNVYGYQVTKQPLPNWNPLANARKLQFPIQHMKLAGADYLIACDMIGGITLYSRTGQAVLQQNLPASFLRQPAISVSGETARIVGHARDGMTYRLSLSSQETDIVAYQHSNVTDADHFFTADLLGGTEPEVVFFSNGDIAAFSEEGPELIGIMDEDNQRTRIFPVQLAGRSNYNIGALMKSRSELYLFTDIATIHPSFPIKGSTPFVITDLSNTNENVLITGGLDNNLLAYKIR